MKIKENLIRRIWANGAAQEREYVLSYLPTLPAAPERFAATGSAWAK